MTEALRGYGAMQARLTAVGKVSTRTAMLVQWQKATIRQAKLTVARRTGNLGRSIHEGVNGDDYAQVVASASYAAAVELGRRELDIYPRVKRALAWGGPRRQSGSLRSGGMATNFARHVHQPARRAQPFLAPAALWALRNEGLLASVTAAWNAAA